MKTMVFVVIVAIVSGCASAQIDKNQCGSFDTERLRADMKAPYRTDREWYEAVLRRLAWQLDCERGSHSVSPNADVTGGEKAGI